MDLATTVEERRVTAEEQLRQAEAEHQALTRRLQDLTAILLQLRGAVTVLRSLAPTPTTLPPLSGADDADAASPDASLVQSTLPLHAVRRGQEE